jgi:hypothetical protein
MNLDIATIFFLLLMINGSLGAIFFGAWLRRPSEVFSAPPPGRSALRPG